jgi:hypothetical protein
MPIRTPYDQSHTQQAAERNALTIKNRHPGRSEAESRDPEAFEIAGALLSRNDDKGGLCGLPPD